MFRRLYRWTLSLAAHRHAKWWLTLVCLLESFIYPIPLDILMIPMMLADRRRSFSIATYALVGSLVGGLVGYGIGYGLMDSLGQWILSVYNLQTEAASLQEEYVRNGWWIVAVGAFTPVPYKVVTLASGMAGMPLFGFLLISLLARGARFYLFALFFYFFGDHTRVWIERYFPWVAAAFVGIVLVGFLAAERLL